MSETTSPRRILVADDDPDTLSIVTDSIAMLGFTPLPAHDGNEAIEVFRTESPDLAILDMNMPFMTGSEVCKAIRTSDLGTHVPILILTARDSVKDKVSALEGGADDYLTKPFHYQELQARVKALLRVRELNLRLLAQNETLKQMQEKLVVQERQAVVGQLAGTAAHQLGQPLSAILLNCYLIEKLPSEDPRHQAALAAIKNDAKRMSEILDKMREIDAAKTKTYYGTSQILELNEAKKIDTKESVEKNTDDTKEEVRK